MRLDVALVERGIATSRHRGKMSIESGIVQVNGTVVTKAAHICEETDTIEIVGQPLRFVSRGGLKLEGGLDQFGISINGGVALDIGASTGGFTQCLLERGAVRVYAVDVGKDQLAKELAAQKRVVNIDGVNVRTLTKKQVPELCDLGVIDLSFISITLVLAHIKQFIKPSGKILALVKPQFEVGMGNGGKNGIVKAKQEHKRVLRAVNNHAKNIGLVPTGVMPSPITGGDGNIEFLMLIELQGNVLVAESEIDKAVELAHKGDSLNA